ncbi:MAG: YaaC family protein, partial [Candidatus Sifarchaeia archaeon]
SRRDLLLFHDDYPYSKLEGKTVNAFEILSALPDMFNFLRENEVELEASRGAIKRQVDFRHKKHSLILTLHSAYTDALKDSIMEQIMISPRTLSCSSVNVNEIGKGFIATISMPLITLDRISVFDAMNTLHYEDTIVFKDRAFTNEAAAHYLLMFCLSMLVRYYPDEWIYLLERGHEIVNYIRYFINLSVRKFPNLILNEMTNTVHYFES